MDNADSAAVVKVHCVIKIVFLIICEGFIDTQIVVGTYEDSVVNESKFLEVVNQESMGTGLPLQHLFALTLQTLVDGHTHYQDQVKPNQLDSIRVGWKLNA